MYVVFGLCLLGPLGDHLGDGQTAAGEKAGEGPKG